MALSGGCGMGRTPRPRLMGVVGGPPGGGVRALRSIGRGDSAAAAAGHGGRAPQAQRSQAAEGQWVSGSLAGREERARHPGVEHGEDVSPLAAGGALGGRGDRLVASGGPVLGGRDHPGERLVP